MRRRAKNNGMSYVIAAYIAGETDFCEKLIPEFMKAKTAVASEGILQTALNEEDVQRVSSLIGN